MIANWFAEQIAARRRHARRRRLQEPVVELVAEKSDIAHLQDRKGFVRNGHERAARQCRLAYAATRQRKGEFIQMQQRSCQPTVAGRFALHADTVLRGNEFTHLAAV